MMLFSWGGRILPNRILFYACVALILPTLRAYALTAPPFDLAQPLRVRVRLVEAVPQVSVRGFDLQFFDFKTGTVPANRRLAMSNDRTSEWEFRCNQGRVRAIRRKGGKTLELMPPVTIESPSGFITMDNRPFRDSLRLYPVGSSCEVVNEVDLEKYLDGLVNAEFSARWPEQAVAAQVVAARTYALYKMIEARRDPKSHFDLDSTERDQVYAGSIKEDFRASRSVIKTKGMILSAGFMKDGKPSPIKAFYHSSCGGFTELPEHVWGRKFAGFKRSVPCPFCSRSPTYAWSSEFAEKELSKELSAKILADGPLPGWPKNWRSVVKAGAMTDLRVVTYNHEARANEVAATWVAGGTKVELRFSATRFRSWLGPARVKSTGFIIFAGSESGKQEIKRWRIRGKGHGHGVGMCQWGAKVMGEKGYSTAAILKHYYPDARISKVW